MIRLLVMTTFLVVAPAALAGAIPVPEPGTLELLGLGGVMAVVIALRRRRKA